MIPGRTGCNIYDQCIDIGYQHCGDFSSGQDDDPGAVNPAVVFPVLLTGINLFCPVADFPRTWSLYQPAENAWITDRYVYPPLVVLVCPVPCVPAG